MKRIISIVIMAGLLLTLASCGDGNNSRDNLNMQSNVSDILEAGKQGGSASNGAAAAVTTKVKEDTGFDTIDIDLTALSSTVVYSEVYNMVFTPDNYRGKVVKMGGSCTAFTSPDTGKTYYSCVIADATACCAQGIEFVLTDDCKIPDDYPQNGDEIEVVGVFDSYMEDDVEYYTLTNASVVSLDTANRTSNI